MKNRNHYITSLLHPNHINLSSDQRGTPNQSKSFRVLQKITDTYNDDPYQNGSDQPAELQQPHYSRPLGPNDMNEGQFRKMRLNDPIQGMSINL